MATKKPPAGTRRVRILVDPGPPELGHAAYLQQEPRQRHRSPRVEQRFGAEEAELEKLLGRRDSASSGTVGMLVRKVNGHGYSGRLAGMGKKQIGRIIDRILLKRGPPQKAG